MGRGLFPCMIAVDFAPQRTSKPDKGSAGKWGASGG